MKNTESRQKRGWLPILLVSVCFILLAVYGSAPLFIPKPASASIPADQFSALRAMQHVRVLAQSPRVVGTPGMEQAVSYLVDSLHRCSIDPEVQLAESPRGQLRNLIVRFPGSHPGNALLIVSHTDSISYGAGDNASGVAVLLEVACSLQAGELLRNDVILLFDDGEEAGYLGGYAFAEKYASISDIRYVIGLDTAAWGPVIVIQTTPGNGNLIRYYADTVQKPTAFGFFANVDWTLAGDTSEIQPFHALGIPGLALEDPTAFTWKHSEADSIESVRPGSLQQMGDQVLSLARRMGNSDLTTAPSAERSYTTLFGLGVVTYPAGWNLPFVILSAIGLGVLTVKGIKQKMLTWRALALSTGALFLVVTGAAALGYLGYVIFNLLFPNPNPAGGSYLVSASLPFLVMILVCVASAYLVVRRKLVNSRGFPTVLLAGLFVWTCFSVASSVFIPAGSHMLTIPLLAAVLAGFLPSGWRFIRFVPAGIATILFAPNAVLTYLSTGMEVLAVLGILLTMNLELWASAYVLLTVSPVKAASP